MQFTYTYLKNAEQNGIIVGHYKGYDVIPTTKARLAKNGESDDYIYLLYDDNNLLYQNGKVFGSVDKNGNVEEFNARRYMLHERREEAKSAFTKEIPRTNNDTWKGKRAEKPTAAGGEAPTAADTSTVGNDEIIADVALGIMVDDTLSNARDMTIDSLLEGFNYGLD